MNLDHHQDDTPEMVAALRTMLGIFGTVLIVGLVILLSAGCGTTAGIDHEGNLEILIPYRVLADPSVK